MGKTAIAEGIAQRMITGDVPDTLKPPCKLIGLDMVRGRVFPLIGRLGLTWSLLTSTFNSTQPPPV